MAIKRSATRKRTARPSNHAGSVKAARLSPACLDATFAECLSAAINKERGTLLKADALLGCLAIALEYGADSQEPIHYPDVAQVARDLVNHAFEALDPLELKRHLPGDEVREEVRRMPGIRLPAKVEFRICAWRRAGSFLRRALEPRASLDRRVAYA